MTSRLAVLPAINRNLPQAFDQNNCGLVAYGSRFGIYVLDIRTSPPTVIDKNVIRNAHRGKTLSISFCKVPDNELLASIGEDKLLKIWDLPTGVFIASLETKECSRVIEWLYDSTSSVAFADTNGYVSKWNFRTNKVVRIKTSSDVSVDVLSSNPKSPELLAAGHTTGAISILNVVNQGLVHKLRSHSQEITSLSWSPVLQDVLLSTSLDLSARLWTLGEDKPTKTYFYPSARNKPEDKKNMKICGLCHPENPDIIFCSNVRGDLGSVTFKEGEPPKFLSFSSKEWDSGYKTVVTMLPYFDKDKEKHMFLSCDHLRISLWDVAEQKSISSIPFLIGTIFDISLSPLHTGSLAICSGDGTIKLWKQNSEDKLLDISTIYIHHRVKIMVAAWHPTEDSVLAYGVDEGRVGIADIHKKKSLYSFETHHSGIVYSLQWGPCRKIKESKELFLYSCGGGTIYTNELKKPKEKAVDFSTLIQLPADLESVPDQCSEISWNCGYSCFAVGSYKGYIDLFNRELNFLARIIVQIKNIETLKWHPAVTLASPQGSPYKSWVAVSGNDDNIHVIDTSYISSQSESTLCKSTKTLVGHKKRVCSISWSNHVDAYLVSGARDGTVQVWNVCSNTPIANYPWHKDMVYTVLWSFTDPDVIYSGGTDNCLRIWNISQQTEICPPSKSVIVRSKPKPKPSIVDMKRAASAIAEMNGTVESQADNSCIGKLHEVQQDKDGFIMNAMGDKYKPKPSDCSSSSFYKKGASLASVLVPKFSKEEHLENVFMLVDHLCNQPNEDSKPGISCKLSKEDTLKIGLFSDQSAALTLLDAKAKDESERENGSIIKSLYLNLMTGNIKQMVSEATERKELNDFLVSVSPSVSALFWHETCEKYAFQLVEEEQYVRASFYFMLCGKLYDGLKLLSEKGKIMEALSFAKAQLPESDPMLEHLLHKTAKFFRMHHLIELEAACYLALKEPIQAAKILFCAADSKYIYAATYICCKFELKEEAEAYAYFCMEKCLSQNDWPTFYKLVEQVESLKAYTALIRVHEIIASQLKLLKKEDGLLSKDIFGVNEPKALIWSGKVIENSKQSLLTEAFDTLISEGIIQLADKESLKRVQSVLFDMEKKRKNCDVSAEAHISIALWATQTILSSLVNDQNDLDSTMKYFHKIFTTSYSIVFLPRVMFWLFLPLDIYYFCETRTFECAVKNADSAIPFESQFQLLYKTLCSKFTQINTSSNLNLDVSDALSFLLKQDVGDSLLLYFCDCYLNELRRLTKKGWRFRCYKNIASTIDKNIINNTVQFSFANDLTSKTETCVVKPEFNSVVVDEVEELIQIALKEADEESQIISESATNDVYEAAEKEKDIAVLVQDHSVVASNDVNNDETDKALEELIQSVLKEADEKARSILESMNESGEQDSLNANNNISSKNGGIGEKTIHVNSEENGSENIKNDNSFEENLKKDKSSKDSFEEIAKEKSCQEGHLECWRDMYLCHDITKLFSSALCRDEYGWLYYLENYLGELDTVIAALAKIQSITKNGSKTTNILNKPVIQKTVVNKISDNDSVSFQEKPKPTEGSLATANISENVQEINGVNVPENDSHALLVTNEIGTTLNSLNNEHTDSRNPKNVECYSNASVPNGNAFMDAEVKDDIGKCFNLLSKDEINNKEGAAKTVINDNNYACSQEQTKIIESSIETFSIEGNFQKVNGVNVPKENSDAMLVTNEIGTSLRSPSGDGTDSTNSKDVACDSNVPNGDSSIGTALTDEHGKILNSTKDELNKKEDGIIFSIQVFGNITNNNIAPDEDMKQINFRGKSFTATELQLEREAVSHRIDNFKIVHFQYPNPFVTASVVTGICCDIFQKNPCKVVQEKFHKIAHQVLEWKKKFPFGNKPLLCEICQKQFTVDDVFLCS